MKQKHSERRSGVFSSKLARRPISEWAELLEVQAKLFAHKEIEVLERLGLAESKGPILDLGCGVGAFTRILRNHFPLSKIVASDINEDFLNIFRDMLKRQPDSNIDVVKWDGLNEPAPLPVKKCRSVILRLVLQHIHDPKELLNNVRASFRPGTRVFVIEEDDSLFQIDPELPAFWEVITAWRKSGIKHANDRYVGKKIPRLAVAAGLKVEHSELLAHTNYDVGLKQLIEYFIKTMQMISAFTPSIASTKKIARIRAEFESYKRKHEGRCLILYPQVITAAVVV